MLLRIALLLCLAASLGCNSKQEVIVPTATTIAPTGELKLLDAGGSGGLTIPGKSGGAPIK